MIERQSSYTIKILKTDNGTEYTNTLFKDYTISKGIIHQFSAPYTPQQNDLAERINYTLLDKVRAILSESNLFKELWPEVLLSVTYIHNRTPHSFLGYKTPYEARYNTKPSISNIRILGSITYHKEARITKLDSRGTSGILLGFNHNQYRVYNPISKRTICTRDCTILEGQYYSSSKEDLSTPSSIVSIDTSTTTSPNSRVQSITLEEVPTPTIEESIEDIIPLPTSTTSNLEDISEDELGYYAFNTSIY